MFNNIFLDNNIGIFNIKNLILKIFNKLIYSRFYLVYKI